MLWKNSFRFYYFVFAVEEMRSKRTTKIARTKDFILYYYVVLVKQLETNNDDSQEALSTLYTPHCVKDNLKKTRVVPNIRTRRVCSLAAATTTDSPFLYPTHSNSTQRHRVAGLAYNNYIYCDADFTMAIFSTTPTKEEEGCWEH